MLQSLLQGFSHFPDGEKILIRRKQDEGLGENKCVSQKTGPCRLLCIYKAVDKIHGNFTLSSFLESFFYWI